MECGPRKLFAEGGERGAENGEDGVCAMYRTSEWGRVDSSQASSSFLPRGGPRAGGRSTTPFNDQSFRSTKLWIFLQDQNSIH